MTTRTCGACGKPIKAKNKTGYCATHAKQSPEYRAKLAAATKRANQLDPTLRERKSAAMREIAKDPAWIERNRQQCTERRLWEQGVAALTPQARAKQGRSFSERHGIGSWCPPDHINLAKALRRSNVPLEEVKRMVAEQEEKALREIRYRMRFD